MVVTLAIPVVSSIRWLIQGKVLVRSCDCEDRCIMFRTRAKVFAELVKVKYYLRKLREKLIS